MSEDRYKQVMAICVAQPVSVPGGDPSELSFLERPIAESPGRFLPQVGINFQKVFSQKRIRSFGDLSGLLTDEDTTPLNRFVFPAFALSFPAVEMIMDCFLDVAFYTPKYLHPFTISFIQT